MAYIEATLNAIQDLCSGALDLVYPPHCVVCRDAASGAYLCPKCIDSITLIEPPVCSKCGTPCQAFLCDECYHREYAFERARSAGVFDGALREAIHALKYRSYEAVAEPLAEIMARAFAGTGLARYADVLVPIPIHASRLLEHGFNHSELLAHLLSRRIGVPVEPDVLRKVRKTAQQVDLPREERALNIQGSFAAERSDRIAGKRVLLIDDVFTTGSTLNEAAHVLIAAGAEEVRAYTLARSL